MLKVLDAYYTEMFISILAALIAITSQLTHGNSIQSNDLSE